MLQKLFKKWQDRASKKDGDNIPFASSEIQEHFKQSKTPLLNTEENRSTRRREYLSDGKPVKQIQNNRKNTKARESNNLLNKMSYFYLQISSKKGMAKYAAEL